MKLGIKTMVNDSDNNDQTIGYEVSKQTPKIFPSGPYSNFPNPLLPQYVPQLFLMIQ